MTSTPGPGSPTPATPTASPTATPEPATPTPTPEPPSPTPEIDQDGDGFTLAGDCNDEDASIHPGAPEVPYDEIDQDCSSGDLTDVDGDGYEGLPAGGDDCDDGDVNTHPGAAEFADGKDNDCDGQIDEGLSTTDDDGDGFSEAQGDCDDADPGRNPDALEVCEAEGSDPTDNNCDGQIDEGVQTTFYADTDHDGYGNPGNSLQACVQPSGYVIDNTDCRDTSDQVHPGAAETCNGADDNCNGQIDEGAGPTWYLDADQDGYGASNLTLVACSQPAGYVGNGKDCDDANASVRPGAVETCNGVDDDCDGQVDEGVQSTWYADVDADGYGDAKKPAKACSQPSGYVADASDCDDSSASISPAAAEICNGLDDNCNKVIDEDVKTIWYADADGDGFGNLSKSTAACSQPAGYVLNNGDCDDANGSINPAALELCNGLDDNCNKTIDENVKSTFYQDVDGDGYGVSSSTTQACSAPSGYVASSGDCNDGSSAINPGAKETCNGIDDNCNAVADEGIAITYYLDADGDGYGGATTTLACSAPTGYVTKNGDCNDANASVHPGTAETYNGVDDDCNGQTDEGVSAGSCKEIKAVLPASVSGVFSIDPDGSAGSISPIQVYCDMSTDGGGWTLSFVKNSAHVGNYPNFGAGYVNTNQLSITPGSASSATSGIGAWLDLNNFSYTTLRLAAYQNGANTFLSKDVYKSDLRIKFGQYGYFLYGDRNGYYWCGGAASYTDAGSGQVNKPSGAPDDCKGHGSLGSGWDFSTQTSVNQGLTLCGADASNWMSGTYGGGAQYYYPAPGAAYAIWAR